MDVVRSVFAPFFAGRGHEGEIVICISVLQAFGPQPGDIPMPRAGVSPQKPGGGTAAVANLNFDRYVQSRLGFFASVALAVLAAAAFARPAVSAQEELASDNVRSSGVKPKALSVGSESLVSKSPVGFRLPEAERRPGEALPELCRLLGIQGVRVGPPGPEQLAAQLRRVQFLSCRCMSRWQSVVAGGGAAAQGLSGHHIRSL